MTTEQRDTMFLRNALHGAPITRERLAGRLREIDEHISADFKPQYRVVKDEAYYVLLANEVYSTGVRLRGIMEGRQQ